MNNQPQAELTPHSTQHLTPEETADLRQQIEAARRTPEAERTDDLFVRGMLLRLDIAEFPNPVVSAVTQDIIIGRVDDHSDFVPDIDLAPYGALRVGISRRHALLKLVGNNLFIVDLGSRNGTVLNGERLEIGKLTLLHDHDELTVGTMQIRMRFLPAAIVSPEKS